MHEPVSANPPHRPLAFVILLIVVIYGAVKVWEGTRATADSSPTTPHAAPATPHAAPTTPHPPDAATAASLPTAESKSTEGSADQGHHAVEGPDHAPPAWFVGPFVFLLAAIAIFPLLAATAHWWENNLHRLWVALGASAVTLLLYWVSHGGQGHVLHILHHALLQEYLPFIVLLFSLYTISGGIRIEGDLEATPVVNTTFMAVGGLLASFVGTTGAAMLLVRPLLETNRERKHVQHTVVFFIFVVCNCGGLLLPIGDPPLFLGYLEGVSFLWTFWRLFWPWLFVNSILLVMYLIADRWIFMPRETRADLQRDATQIRPLTISGWWPNAALLVGVVLCVALLDPTKEFPGTVWRAWPYLREVALLLLVALSLLLGSEPVRRANQFNYGAILEVAALFVGIFICMQPALEILHERGASLGVNTPHRLFGVSGALSSVLDNAPTYLVFFRTAAAEFGGVEAFVELVTRTDSAEAVRANAMLAGVSLGSVFMGAMTYIGNGPNFMVRAIAEQSGVKMPSFFGYTLCYALPCLLPVLVLAAWLFL